jgi:hypothetical protein
MPFPVDPKYIQETEDELNVKFPPHFCQRMMESNGGELFTEEFEIQLYPFFDKSDKKRISRTSNHIALETKHAKDWPGFAENYIAVGTDGFGNQLVLTHDGNGILTDKIYFWDHETGELEKIADTINDLEL